MHLLEQYSLNTGVKIRKPFMVDHIFPIESPKYITLHNSKKSESRNYNYWPDVIGIIKPFLADRGIKIVLVGEKSDSNIKNVDINLLGKTTLKQLAYVVKNAQLHLGVDSLPVHLANGYGVPSVSLYSNTSHKHSGPYWNKNFIAIEADRKGNKPNYSDEEYPKTINTIKPETIAASVLTLLDIKHDIKIETIFIGEEYHNFIIEFVPNCVLDKNFLNNGSINVRMDLEHNEEFLAKALSSRKCNIFTQKPINLNYIKYFKDNILAFNVELTDENIFSLKDLEDIQKTGVKLFISYTGENEEKLSKYRLEFFDFEIEKTIKKSKKNLDYGGKLDYNNLYFRSNKFIVSNNKMYLSKFDWKNNKPLKNPTINISKFEDHEDVWEDIDYFYIFKQK